MCGILPIGFLIFSLPCWGPRCCLGDSRPLCPALLFRGWGLPASGLRDPRGGGAERRSAVPGRLAPPPVCARWLLDSLRFDVGTSSQGQPSLWFQRLLLLLPLVDLGSVPLELWLFRVSLHSFVARFLFCLRSKKIVVCAD